MLRLRVRTFTIGRAGSGHTAPNRRNEAMGACKPQSLIGLALMARRPA